MEVLTYLLFCWFGQLARLILRSFLLCLSVVHSDKEKLLLFLVVCFLSRIFCLFKIFVKYGVEVLVDVNNLFCIFILKFWTVILWALVIIVDVMRFGSLERIRLEGVFVGFFSFEQKHVHKGEENDCEEFYFESYWEHLWWLNGGFVVGISYWMQESCFLLKRGLWFGLTWCGKWSDDWLFDGFGSWFLLWVVNILWVYFFICILIDN